MPHAIYHWSAVVERFIALKNRTCKRKILSQQRLSSQTKTLMIFLSGFFMVQKKLNLKKENLIEMLFDNTCHHIFIQDWKKVEIIFCLFRIFVLMLKPRASTEVTFLLTTTTTTRIVLYRKMLQSLAKRK